LFEKSQKTLRIYAKNTDLRAEVDDLEEKVGSRDVEVAQLKEESAQLKGKSTQLKEQLAKLKEELVCKNKHFLQTKDELTRDAAESYATGFEDAMTQVPVCIPNWADEENRGWAAGRR